MDSHTVQNSAHRRPLEAQASPQQRRVMAGLLVVLLGWTGLYATMFVYHGLRLVAYPYDVDNSEAYLIYQGERLARGEFLYQPIEQPPFLVDNYPPVYPLLIAASHLIAGPNFHWARGISFAASIGVACLLAFWVLCLTQDRWSSWFTGLVYLSFYHVYDWGALARVDALGVFLAAAGLLGFERSQNWKTALAWFLPALFTRQTLFAAVLAVFCVLWQQQGKKPAWVFLSCLAGMAVVIFGGMLWLSGGGAFWHLIVYNANEFRWRDVWIYTRHWMLLYSVWGCAPLLVLLMARMQPHRALWRASPLLNWFTFWAILEAGLCGKIGSAPNYLLSVAAAASMGLGIVLAALRQFAFLPFPGQHAWFRLAPLALFVLAGAQQSILAWHVPHVRDWSLTPTSAYTQLGRSMEMSLERRSGPVLADRAGIPLLAGHEPVFQPFILTQLSRQGLWDESLILQRIKAQEYERILLHFDLGAANWDRERITPGMIQSMRSAYTLERNTGPYYLYRPKETSNE